MTTITRDNILYLTIALAIVGILALVAWYQDVHGLPIRIPISDRQFALFLTTAVVFGYSLQASRSAWRKPRFWIIFSVLLLLYVPLQWLVLQHIKINIFTVQIVVLAELFALFALLGALLPSRHHRPK